MQEVHKYNHYLLAKLFILVYHLFLLGLPLGLSKKDDIQIRVILLMFLY